MGVGFNRPLSDVSCWSSLRVQWGAGFQWKARSPRSWPVAGPVREWTGNGWRKPATYGWPSGPVKRIEEDVVLPEILKWLGTITVLLLMNPAVDARAQSEVQPAKQPPAQSREQSPASPEEQSAEQSPSRPVERSTAQTELPPAKLPPADAYRLTVTIHGAFGLCHNDEFGSEELYVVVKRVDLELQDQIDDIEREARQITGRSSWRNAEQRVDSLRKQDFDSKSDPLSGAELESLERLRSKQPSERTEEEAEEFRSLRTRAPVSTADASVLARMQELKTQRRRLLRQVHMRSSANKPGSLRVYPDDELQVVLMEDDPFFDDTCFGSTVLLNPSSLTTPSLEIKKDDNTLLTLNFMPLSR